MKPRDIEFLINHWEDLAGNYREHAKEFNVPGFEALRVELNAIAVTLERCANDLKNAQK